MNCKGKRILTILLVLTLVFSSLGMTVTASEKTVKEPFVSTEEVLLTPPVKATVEPKDGSAMIPLSVSAPMAPGIEVQPLSVGEEFIADGVRYKVRSEEGSSGTVAVSSTQNFTGVELEIPSAVQHEGTSYTVVAMEAGAFIMSKDLKEVSLPDKLQIIDAGTKQGNGAFSNCSNLESIDLGGVTEVGAYAFYSCKKLKEVDLSKVTLIGGMAFSYCENLSRVTFPETPYEIESGGSGAFWYCKSLKEIDLGGVTSIGEYAFYYCESLDTIDLGEATKIGRYAFYAAESLESIDLSNLGTIGDSAFAYCTNLKNITFPKVNCIIEGAKPGKGHGAFSNCTNLETIDLSEVTSIGERAFANCTGLKCVWLSSIPSDVKENAFLNVPVTALALFPNELEIMGTDFETRWEERPMAGYIKTPQERKGNIDEDFSTTMKIKSKGITSNSNFFWEKDGVTLSGQDSDTLTLPHLAAKDGGSYILSLLHEDVNYKLAQIELEVLGTDPTDPSNPTKPTDPSNSTDPSNQTNPTNPSDPADHPQTGDNSNIHLYIILGVLSMLIGVRSLIWRKRKQ